MSHIVENIRHHADAIAPALALEPGIRADLAGASLRTVLAVVAAYVERRPRRVDTILAYLEQHGCAFGADTIEFLLDAYGAMIPWRCLWRLDGEGRYVSLG